MKTAEKYLRDAYDTIALVEFTERKEVDPIVLRAMQEYAKQEAIEFYNWCEKNAWRVDHEEEITHTTSELYKIYQYEKCDQENTNSKIE